MIVHSTCTTYGIVEYIYIYVLSWGLKQATEFPAIPHIPHAFFLPGRDCICGTMLYLYDMVHEKLCHSSVVYVTLMAVPLTTYMSTDLRAVIIRGTKK